MAALCVYARELFLDVPGGHVARIPFKGAMPHVLQWNVPTWAALIGLLAALIAIIASVVLLLNHPPTFALRVCQFGGLATTVVAFAVWARDFVSGAGTFR